MDINTDVNAPNPTLELRQVGITKTRRTWGLVLGVLGIILSVMYLHAGVLHLIAYRPTTEVFLQSPDLLVVAYGLMNYIEPILPYLAYLMSGILTIIYIVTYTRRKKDGLIRAGVVVTAIGFLITFVKVLVEVLFFIVVFSGMAFFDTLYSYMKILHMFAVIGLTVFICLSLGNIGPRVKRKGGDIFVMPLAFFVILCITDIVTLSDTMINMNNPPTRIFVSFALMIVRSFVYYFCLVYPISFLLPNINKTRE